MAQPQRAGYEVVTRRCKSQPITPLHLILSASRVEGRQRDTHYRICVHSYTAGDAVKGHRDGRKTSTVTGQSADQKIYYGHSYFPGGLNKASQAKLMERKPEEVCTDLTLYWKVSETDQRTLWSYISSGMPF